jgi:hypothetical protein
MAGKNGSILANGTRYFDDTTYVSEAVIYTPDVHTHLVQAVSAAVEVYICMDTPDVIENGTPVWHLYKTVAMGTFSYEAMEYGPNALKFKFSGTFKGWVKG